MYIEDSWFVHIFTLHQKTLTGEGVKLSSYRNFAKCHQALFRIPRVGLGVRLLQQRESERRNYCREVLFAGALRWSPKLLSLGTWRSWCLAIVTKKGVYHPLLIQRFSGIHDQDFPPSWTPSGNFQATDSSPELFL